MESTPRRRRPWGLASPSSWVGEGGSRNAPGRGLLLSGHCSEGRRASGGSRARPPGGVAPLTPWPQVGGGGQGRSAARRGRPGAPPARVQDGLPARTAPRRSSRGLGLSDLNRGGRAARLRFPTAIGCGGAVTSARRGAGGAWKGSVREAPSPESPRAREKPTPRGHGSSAPAPR